MKITVNGGDIDMEEGITVASLFERLGMALAGTAVELNGEIVPRTQHHSSRLREGDRLEIVRMAGGG